MTSARDARLQERLRGSQRRAVKDFDFALSFPAAPAPAPASSQPAPISRRTPQPELPPQVSTRRTPGSRGRGRPSNSVLAEESNKPVTHSASNANISAKRRKLDSDEAPSSSSRSTRSSQHSRRPDIYAFPEDDPPVPDTTSGSIEQQPQAEQRDEAILTASIPRLRAARTPSLPVHAHEEITESPTDAPGSGRRARVGISDTTLQSSQLQDVLQADTVTRLAPAETSSPFPQSKRKRGQTTPTQSGPSSKRLRRIPKHLTEAHNDEPDELDELSPEQPISKRPHPDDLDELSPEQPKRRGRRSQQLDEIDELSPEQVNRRGRKPKPVVRDIVGNAEDEEVSKESIEEVEEAEEIDDQEAAIVLKKNRGRRISRNLPAAESPDLDEVTEPTPPIAKSKRAKARQISTPAKQRHPKNHTAKKDGGKASKKSSKPPEARAKGPIPVTVHRLTKRMLYDDDERDADILNSEIPYAKRGGVNVIDVLSQVCQEVVERALGNLDELRGNCEDPALRREYMTKSRAVESFGQELQTRLIEHTVNLDNTFALEKRFREEQKKKLALREDILRIRGEREQVALRMDKIRIRHENETNSARERDGLNTHIHDIELAIELGKSQNLESSNGVEMSGIELLLKRVADQVSNKSDSGGMLNQIKEFNSFLERAALALESKRS